MLIIGHRGCNYPATNQNTIRAFRKVVEEGCSAIECDVQVTLDQELVIVHNLDLAEVSTGRGLVSQTSLADIRKIWAGNPERGKDKIPTLRELLSFHESLPSAQKFIMHLELKGHSTGEPTAAMLRSWLDSQRLKPEHVLVSSFYWNELSHMQKICPELRLAVLSGAIHRPSLLTQLQQFPKVQVQKALQKVFAYAEEDYIMPRSKHIQSALSYLTQVAEPQIQEVFRKSIIAAFAGHDYQEQLFAMAAQLQAYSVNLWADSLCPEHIQKAHSLGYKVYAYTVNEVEKMRELASYGLDGLFTDDYALASQVFC